MIKKYTRRNINQQARLHDKEFVVYDDALAALDVLYGFILTLNLDECEEDRLKELVNE